ncbi:MAG: DUF2452 domain-containing protein [Cytophagales bacterium]|nr:DUF2452 domain-containing protein [Cytophagales bacterium]MDW8384012.1 DUF2452 domain-containing protein [Flammeovirgaceae bacterium]
MQSDSQNIGKEIDVEKIDLEKLAEKTTDTPGILPYAHQVGSAVVKPEDLGKIKGKAVSAMHEQTKIQMQQLMEQMQLLKQQADTIKHRVSISEKIYRAHIPFEPLINHVYYLYQKEDGTEVLSMIAPNEWGRSKGFPVFIAKVKLLADHTWEILEE